MDKRYLMRPEEGCFSPIRIISDPIGSEGQKEQGEYVYFLPADEKKPVRVIDDLKQRTESSARRTAKPFTLRISAPKKPIATVFSLMARSRTRSSFANWDRTA